jgi:surface-anchored protein
VDVGIAIEDGAWDLHVHDESNDAEYEPDAALLHVGPAAAEARPAGDAFDFIGVAAGETFWRLPQSEDPRLLFLGVGAEEIEPGTFTDGRVRLVLKAVNGPGHFSVWQSTDAGPAVFMATSDGITAADLLTVLEGGHEHYNWGFSARGRYEVTFQAWRFLDDGDDIPDFSEEVTYYFSVDNLGRVRLDAGSYSVGEGGTVTVTVERVGRSDGPLTVLYAVAEGTAGAGDYVPAAGALTFADGETVKTFTVTANQDAEVEDDETVVLRLTAPEGSLTELGEPAEATLTILDDDVAAPPLFVEGVVVNGGADQRSNVETVAVRFSGATNLQALIDSGAVVDAVRLFRSNGRPVELSLSHFRWDAATSTLTIDLTVDGFGGSRLTRFADGRYELRLDTSLITSADGAVGLTDDDGTVDGVYRSRFHRLRGDFNGDRVVNRKDVDLFFGHIGGVEGKNNRYDFAFDLTGKNGKPDGRVGGRDLKALRFLLGRTV